jgi:signal transduction histidine kinase
VLLLATGVIFLFSLTDYFILHRFSWATTAVRLAWAGGTLAGAFLGGKLRAEAERDLFVALGLLTAVCFTALVALTGGVQSPMFHWILAVPLTVAVVVQDHPRATLASAAGTLTGGIWMLASGSRPFPEVIAWGVQAAGMGALAVYASSAYQALREREARAARERQEMLERALLLEGERRARQSAEEALRGRDEFLTVASHELKTPLTALKLQAQLAQREVRTLPEPRPVWAERLQTLERHVDRMAALVDTLLDVSRIRLGRLSLELEEVDLSALAQEVAHRFGPQLAQAGSTLEVQIAPGVVGRWDRLRLEQVLSNLLANAARYGAGRPVNLQLDAAQGVAQVVVRDQGIGIAPADQQRIFGRFERGVSDRQYGGLGLGLWIVEQIVSALGGTVAVESQVGQGATFRVRLPLQPTLSPGAGDDLH